MRGTIEIVRERTAFLKVVGRGEEMASQHEQPMTKCACIKELNPTSGEKQGCGGASSSAQEKGKKPVRKAPTCRICGGKGHI